jgi:predicted kinase
VRRSRPVRQLLPSSQLYALRTDGIGRPGPTEACDHLGMETDPIADALEGGPGVMFLITGIQASGKSTVAQLLAERFPRSAHVRGDLFRRMLVASREEPLPGFGPVALAQLRLRHQLAVEAADRYMVAGFTTVLQDCFLGEQFPWAVGQVRSRPLLVVMLAPRADEVARREAGRRKKAYDPWTIDGLDQLLREQTPRIGLWLDSSDQRPDQTVEEILARAWRDGRVD